VSEAPIRCIRCHTCNYPTDLPLGGVRQLPQNYLIVRRIEALRLQAGEDVISKVWCSLCTDEISVRIDEVFWVVVHFLILLPGHLPLHQLHLESLYLVQGGSRKATKHLQSPDEKHP